MNSIWYVVRIPTHVRVGLRPRMIVRQFPPMVRTYLKSTTGNFWVPARTLIAVKLLRGTRWLIVEWLNFWTGIDGPIRSSHCDSARVSNPPRRPNFAQNMHPNKRCRRSLARPNRSAPEYHDIDHDHDVAVGWPRRFCVIAPMPL